MVRLKGLTKYYIKDKQKINVLNKVNYEFLPNKLYCIMGQSGSGKSTLIQCLGLLLKPNDGDILINGKSIKKLKENEKAIIRNKEIGFVFQSFYLNPLLKAYENVMLPTYVNKNIKNSEAKEQAYKLLEKLGLKGRETHYPKELSGGEQQRVAIARALINNPNIILADEPTGALDSINEKKILTILKSLSQKGKCVIVVSHSDRVKEYADVVLRIEDNTIKEVTNHEKNV